MNDPNETLIWAEIYWTYSLKTPGETPDPGESEYTDESYDWDEACEDAGLPDGIEDGKNGAI